VSGSAAFYAVKALAGAEIQPNGGCYRPLKVITRPGSVMDASPDKPVVGGNHETSQRAVDAIFRALEPVLGERMSAGGNTSAGLLIFSGPGRNGRWATFYEPHGGGEGANATRDGMDVVRVHLTNVMNTPVEVVESEYRLRIEAQRVRHGSGGAGAHRGGDGQVRVYRVVGETMSLTTMFERRLIAPYGLRGGADGQPARCVVEYADGTRQELAGKANVMLGRDDRVIFETPGGGGYGPPA
jgi:N-methylhydantoinase B